MKSVMVRYKVKPDRADENEGYIKRVFEQLKRERPSGLRYASFKLGDGVSFVHIASLDAGDGSNPLGALPAFKVFAADIKERCDELPATAFSKIVTALRKGKSPGRSRAAHASQ
jgi:hypothetical protein